VLVAKYIRDIVPLPADDDDSNDQNPQHPISPPWIRLWLQTIPENNFIYDFY